MKCDECTCTYESCSCKLPGSKCAYETDDKKDDGARKMKKNKPRWKDLPFYERFARTCKRNGSADWMVEHIRERGKQKEKEVRETEDK